MTLAEEHQQVAEIALDHFRESFLLCFRTMTDGLPQQYRKQAREIIRFFSEETTPEIWAQLTQIPDPDTLTPDPQTGMVDMTKARSLADSWVAQWEQLSAAVGKVA